MTHDFICRSIHIALCLMGLLWGLPAQAAAGEESAKSWCSSCHLYPAPQLLDKKTWTESVLPSMGARLGIPAFKGRDYYASPDAPEGAFASEPLMDLKEWARIFAWYETEAPDALAAPEWQARTGLDLFAMEEPAIREHDFPTSTAILIDETAQQILVGDSYQLNVEFYADDLQLLSAVGSGGAISRIKRLPSGNYVATNMGSNIGQTEDLDGLLVEIAPNDGAAPTIAKRLARNLHRPVDVAVGDFNKDGATDFITAGFGTYAGKLTLHLSQADGTLVDKVLLDAAGVTSVSVVGDDLIVLVAQAGEQIVRLKDFANPERGTAETLMQFPPVRGSSSLSVADINGDGLMDLLYTAGDNADISPIYKPYHGVYVYAGQADGSFEQSLFFPLDGATSAMAADFDADGDTDIAAIAYYASIERSLDQTEFVYLENDAGTFTPKYIDGLGERGRFIALSAGDVDGDGDLDIALANMSFGPYGPMDDMPTALQQQWISDPRFVLLRNQLH